MVTLVPVYVVVGIVRSNVGAMVVIGYWRTFRFGADVNAVAPFSETSFKSRCDLCCGSSVVIVKDSVVEVAVAIRPGMEWRAS